MKSSLYYVTSLFLLANAASLFGTTTTVTNKSVYDIGVTVYKLGKNGETQVAGTASMEAGAAPLVIDMHNDPLLAIHAYIDYGKMRFRDRPSKVAIPSLEFGPSGIVKDTHFVIAVEGDFVIKRIVSAQELQQEEKERKKQAKERAVLVEELRKPVPSQSPIRKSTLPGPL